MAEEDALEVFSSSLHSLFDHVVPANGDPLELFNYDPPKASRQPRLVCRIPPQQVNSLFAHHVWNASLILADRISNSQLPGIGMSRPRENDRPERGDNDAVSVCELGCGAGIPGLIAARSPNVKRVVLTDYDDPLLIENLERNLDLAYRDDPTTRSKLVALGHTWGDPNSLTAVLASNDDERFAHVLMADTLWLTEAQSALVETLTRVLAYSATSRIHLVAGFHSGRNAVRSFLRKARGVGLEPKVDADGEGWRELAVGGETRPWGWDLGDDTNASGAEDDGWVDEKETSSERGKWVVVGAMGWSREKLAQPFKIRSTPLDEADLASGSVPALSHDLLSRIFSHLGSSPAALFNVLLVSRTFHDLAKRFLYEHVRITTREQRVQLREIRRDDAKLIKTVTVQGTKLPVEQALAGKGKGRRQCRLGSGCLEEILTGKLLDISAIEVIHVANVNEAPSATGRDRTEYGFRPAVHLVELSINGHRGGGSLWDAFLRDYARTCPRLARVGVVDVTRFEYHDWSDHEVAEQPWVHATNHALHQRLEVVVCNHKFGLGQDGTGVATKHLLLSAPPTPVTAGWLRLAFKSGFNVRFVRLDGDDIPPLSNFQMLVDGARLVEPKRPTFLSLPYYRSELDKDVRTALEQLDAFDCHVYYAEDDDRDRRDSISIIPRQFVEFVTAVNEAKEPKKEVKHGADVTNKLTSNPKVAARAKRP